MGFEVRERGSDDELKEAFEALAERLRELLVPPGALGGLRLPLLAIGQGLPLLEGRLLETNEALHAVVADSEQALGAVNEAVRPLLKQLHAAVSDSGAALSSMEQARSVIAESAEGHAVTATSSCAR